MDHDSMREIVASAIAFMVIGMCTVATLVVAVVCGGVYGLGHCFGWW